MKFRYQLAVVGFCVALMVLVTLFTNCQGLNQGSDEFGAIVFSDHQEDCTTGRICRDSEDLDCYDAEFFFERDAGIVCQKYPPEAQVKTKGSRTPASVSKPRFIKRMPAVYQQTK